MSKTKQMLLRKTNEEDKHLDDAYHYEKHRVNRERLSSRAPTIRVYKSNEVHNIFKDIIDIYGGKIKLKKNESRNI
jgi:hypothetical protein|tara:strand:+ start:461 stop:688 length:228 start_codon:yes stop_codon:yes gene_type:complete